MPVRLSAYAFVLHVAEELESTVGMGWLTRVGLFAGGLFIIALAKSQLQAGHVVFSDANYHQTTFAAGGIGIGIRLCLLVFLPPRDWVYKHITTGRKSRKRR
jgi:hypothetical protein